eukprot:GILK01012627.1.p1 GENE.GILK01012627.1~~GILK01012627.1.p1  ORF type:complete len:166 (-),score=11.20 GILK01012627.1:69-566(-)
MFRFPLCDEVAAGAIAGFLSSMPMNAAMNVMNDLLADPTEKTPHRNLIDNAMDRAGVDASGDARQGASIAASLGYGTVAGALYFPLLRVFPAANVVGSPGVLAAKGASYGAAVWALSYFGLMPALRVCKHPEKASLRKHLISLLANLIWGSSLGVMAHKMLVYSP